MVHAGRGCAATRERPLDVLAAVLERFFATFGRAARHYNDMFGRQMTTKVRELGQQKNGTFRGALLTCRVNSALCSAGWWAHAQEQLEHALADVGVLTVEQLESAVFDDVVRHRERLLRAQDLLLSHIRRLEGVRAPRTGRGRESGATLMGCSGASHDLRVPAEQGEPTPPPPVKEPPTTTPPYVAGGPAAICLRCTVLTGVGVGVGVLHWCDQEGHGGAQGCRVPGGR